MTSNTRHIHRGAKVAAQRNTSVPRTAVEKELECGPMPNVMAALPNISGVLCSTPQSLADAHCQDAKPVEISLGASNSRTDLSRQWTEVHYIVRTCGEILLFNNFFPIVDM